MELLFLLSVAVVLYMFIGYPLLLALLAPVTAIRKAVSGKPPKTELHDFPLVSVVIAAHNEENSIVRRMQNLLSQSYPMNKVQFIVGLDGCSDSTKVKLESQRENIENEGATLKIIEFADRSGKPTVLNAAIGHCEHDIVVFADVRQTYASNALRNLIKHFADERIGAVSGELFLEEPTDRHGVAEAGAYWRYEKLIRKLESKYHSTIGATGAIYAIRKPLYQEIPVRTLIDDVVIPMQICMQGHQVKFAGDAHAYDVAPSDSNREWFRKVRTLAGNWQLLSIRPNFFNPIKNPVWLQFMSHKMLRLTLPFCLLTALFSSYLMIDQQFFATAFMLQCLLYAIGCASFFFDRLRQLRIPGLIYFFCILNAAIVVGFYRLASGKKEGLWTFAYKTGS
ncbi:MAG: glycosyltransferase family 2 protein [Pseudomonadales bacterium]